METTCDESDIGISRLVTIIIYSRKTSDMKEWKKTEKMQLQREEPVEQKKIKKTIIDILSERRCINEKSTGCAKKNFLEMKI